MKREHRAARLDYKCVSSNVNVQMMGRAEKSPFCLSHWFALLRPRLKHFQYERDKRLLVFFSAMQQS